MQRKKHNDILVICTDTNSSMGFPMVVIVNLSGLSGLAMLMRQAKNENFSIH